MAFGPGGALPPGLGAPQGGFVPGATYRMPHPGVPGGHMHHSPFMQDRGPMGR